MSDELLPDMPATRADELAAARRRYDEAKRAFDEITRKGGAAEAKELADSAMRMAMAELHRVERERYGH